MERRGRARALARCACRLVRQLVVWGMIFDLGNAFVVETVTKKTAIIKGGIKLMICMLVIRAVT